MPSSTWVIPTKDESVLKDAAGSGFPSPESVTIFHGTCHPGTSQPSTSYGDLALIEQLRFNQRAAYLRNQTICVLYYAVEGCARASMQREFFAGHTHRGGYAGLPGSGLFRSQSARC
jgi:hypothetical protein